MSVQQSSTVFGSVTEFDEPVGLGVVQSVDGPTHPFHCTAIADGSRNIAIGAAVSFRLMPGRHGQMEAVDIRAR